jgi:hypothetical protein
VSVTAGDNTSCWTIRTSIRSGPLSSWFV